MKKEVKYSGKGSFGRALAGILVAYAIYAVVCLLFFWAYSEQISGNKDAVPNWIVTVLLCLILFLYSYGWLGFWQANLMEARNIVVRIVGKICAYIGFIFRPYPLLAFGPNKKKYFTLFVSLPLAILGIVFIVMAVLGVKIDLPVSSEQATGNSSVLFYILGAVSLINALLALLTKKCPNCGCLMGKIDSEYLDSSTEYYNREYSQNIGYVSDGKGNTVDVYQNYDVQHKGSKNTYAKTFTCMRCGTKKQGRAYTVHEMDLDDPRNSLTHH